MNKKFIKYKFAFFLSPLIVLGAGCGLFGSSATSGGFIKTVNGGADWQFINTYADNKSSLSGVSVSSMDFDPRNKERIFAGAFTGGLYLSEDSGNHWNRILSRISVFDLAIDPTNSDHIYSTGYFADHGRVYETKDAGKSWEEIFNDAGTQNAVRTIAINPNNIKELLIGLANGTIIKSSDGGASWTLAVNINDRVNRIRWRGSEVYAIFRTKGLLRSVDGGQNFTELTQPLRQQNGILRSSVSGVGTDFHQFSISDQNSGTIYVTNSAGLFKSLDSGTSWQRISLPQRVENVVIRAVAVAPNNENTVYVSAGSTIYKTLNGGQAWQTQSVPTTGFINFLLVNPQFTQIAYGGIYINQ